MIKFENTETYGWVAAIRGMRNPLNSWAKSDSDFSFISPEGVPAIGKNDFELMWKLRHAGTDHRKFMRMIQVSVDITAPLYWWKEFDTYKVGTVANSCSTMHKIADKEFELDDFSYEHLLNAETKVGIDGTDAYGLTSLNVLDVVVDLLNYYRKLFLETKDKEYWWQMIQLLPSSYNQKRTVLLNYEVLANMAKKGSRRDHKLDEWRVGFMDWIKTLPYSELIFGEEAKP